MNTYTTIFLIFLATVTLQVIVTYQFTNTKEFSKRALIRNVSIGFAVYFAITTKHYYILLIPIFLEIIIEGLKYNGIFMEKYIATKYLYNDYFTELVKNDDIYSNFTEANYDNILGFSTTDYSQENIKKVLEWCLNIYTTCYKEKNGLLTGIDGKKHEASELKKLTDNNKFKYICEKCEIKPGMRILEIGFGEGDFMKYIYDNYGIKCIGVSISDEQVNFIKDKGFDAYSIDAWDMNPDILGKFDLIIQCGNLEYIKCQGEPDNVYFNYCKIIKSILNNNGKYFITCIHRNRDFKFTLNDKIKCYILWSGNDGLYPSSKNDFSDNAKKLNLINVYQEDRTIDYLVTSVLFLSYFRCRKQNKCLNTLNIMDLLLSIFKTIAAPYYIHSYITYTPNELYYFGVWLWQFTPQERNDILQSPATLEYILFQNEN